MNCDFHVIINALHFHGSLLLLVCVSFLSLFFLLCGFLNSVAALMAVKREMRDETGAMNGWDLNSVDPCTWNMVGCSLEGFVFSL